MYYFIYLGILIFAIIILIFISKKRKNQTVCSVSTFPAVLFMIGSYFQPSKAKYMKEVGYGTVLLQIITGAYHAYRKKRIFSMSWGGVQQIQCIHHDIVEAVLGSYTILNKDKLYEMLHLWLGTGLLTSDGDKWRKRRKMLTPAFHFRILEDFLVIFNEQAQILAKNLENCSKEKWIDIIPLIALCTLDIIGESAMGISLNAQRCSDSEYVKAVRSVSDLIVQRYMQPLFWNRFVFYFTPLARKMRKNLKILHGFSRMVIREKKSKLLQDISQNKNLDNFEDLGIKKRRAFLDLLLYHHLTDESLTDEDIREEVDTFMFEGHDTTSMGISWTLYLLGLHPIIEQKVHQELSDIFGDLERTMTHSDLKEMKYLECVIKESHRLYPPVPFILRRHPEDITLDNHVIGANTSLVVPIYQVHRDPEAYYNPEVFDPDRFLAENCVGRNPFAYIPFSAGPRNCIGQRFAMMEEKTIIGSIIRRFKLHSIDQRDKLLVGNDLILRPKNGIRMVIERRED